MRWINSLKDEAQAPHSPRPSETGAITVMTALLSVALLLMVAMVLDLGIAYAEKAELQNGADAAALAVAGECAILTDPCTVAGEQALANSMAGGNSKDGKSRVEISIAGGVVKATTATLDHAGNHMLSLPLASLTGLSGAQVQAHAEASWGGVSSGLPVFPFAAGACELNPTTHPMGVDRVLISHGSLPNDDGSLPKDGKCSAWNGPAGLNMPGGFGLLTTAGNCTPTMTVGQPWVESSTGASLPNGCKSIIDSSLVGKEILLPIFGYADGQGAGGGYKIVGWGVFVLKGWNLPSNDAGKTYNWPASNSVQGFYGHFTKKLTYEEGFTFGGPPEFGATGVSLTK